jgi:hypothetical protein
MATVTALPLFHLYGDPPDDQAFDFIHVETIASRSSAHDWLIRAHRPELGRLVSLLLEKETVDGEEVYAIVGRAMPQHRSAETVALAPHMTSPPAADPDLVPHRSAQNPVRLGR